MVDKCNKSRLSLIPQQSETYIHPNEKKSRKKKKKVFIKKKEANCKYVFLQFINDKKTGQHSARVKH